MHRVEMVPGQPVAAGVHRSRGEQATECSSSRKMVVSFPMKVSDADEMVSFLGAMPMRTHDPRAQTR